MHFNPVEFRPVAVDLAHAIMKLGRLIVPCFLSLNLHFRENVRVEAKFAPAYVAPGKWQGNA